MAGLNIDASRTARTAPSAPTALGQNQTAAGSVATGAPWAARSTGGGRRTCCWMRGRRHFRCRQNTGPKDRPRQFASSEPQNCCRGRAGDVQGMGTLESPVALPRIGGRPYPGRKAFLMPAGSRVGNGEVGVDATVIVGHNVYKSPAGSRAWPAGSMRPRRRVQVRGPRRTRQKRCRTVASVNVLWGLAGGGKLRAGKCGSSPPPVCFNIVEDRPV